VTAAPIDTPPSGNTAIVNMSGTNFRSTMRPLAADLAQLRHGVGAAASGRASPTHRRDGLLDGLRPLIHELLQ